MININKIGDILIVKGYINGEEKELKVTGDESINRLFELLENFKTIEEIKIEELEKENKEMLKIIAEKTTDAEKIELIKSFPLWEEGVEYWSEMDIPFVVYPDYESGSLYRVINKDIVKSQSDWTPDVAVSLFKKVVPSGVILEFGKNLDGTERELSTNPYMAGEKCIENGFVYSSLIDNNVWSPSDYPSGWKKEKEV